MTPGYTDNAPSRADIDASRGPLVLEFGSNGCGICVAARPMIAAVLAEAPQVPLVQVQDGRGRLLGRAFGVKLWPTLVFLRDGLELARVVRPTEAGSLRAALGKVLD